MIKEARQTAQTIDETIERALAHRSEEFHDPSEFPVYYETYFRCHLRTLKIYSESLLRTLGREEEKSEGCD